MQPGAAPRTTAPGVGDDGGAALPLPEYHSQECRPAIRPTAPDARAHGPRWPESSPVGPHQSTAYAGPGVSPGPAGVLGEPDDIAHAMRYLASRAARYITGQTLVVDGGSTLPESPVFLDEGPAP